KVSDSGWRPKYMHYVTIAFVTSFLTSNILAFKIVQVMDLKFGAAAVFFPISLVIGDIQSEVYGYARARRAVFIGLAGYLYFMLASQITMALPPAPQWTFQPEYERFFGFAPRVFFAGCLAYLCSELVNAYIVSRMKIMQRGKLFPVRAMVSATAGE